MPKVGRQSLRMRLALIVLSLVALGAGGRVVQLARTPLHELGASSSRQRSEVRGRRSECSDLSPLTSGLSPAAMQQAALREEMARLISVCPASASINLDQTRKCAAEKNIEKNIVEQEIDNPPPVRLPAITPISSPLVSGQQIPSISYPVPVRIASAANTFLTNQVVSTDQVASKTPASNSFAFSGEGNWLVDPHEWYSEEELQNLNGTKAGQDKPAVEKPQEEKPQEEKPAKIAPPLAEPSPTEIAPASDAASTNPEPLPAPTVEDEPDALPSALPSDLPNAADAPTMDDGPEELPLLAPSLIPSEASEPTNESAPPQRTMPEDITPIEAPPVQRPVFDPPEVKQSLPVILPESPPATSPPPVTSEAFPPPPAPAATNISKHASKADTAKDDDPHAYLFAKNCYPSARDCAKCHEKIYNEWSSSSHAYAMVSPMFHKFEQKINDLSQGTIGYFCYRCHSPVGTAMGIRRDQPLWEIPEVAREGIGCISCHRVQERYAKVNGERRIEPGPIFAPVFGGIGGDGVAEAIHRKDHFKLKTSPHAKGPGQDIHTQGVYFDQITKSEFCVSCHQVAVHPGIKLEVVWEQYRASPACKKGIRCQDCHMGRIPGIPSGFEFGPAADVSGKNVNPNRKHSNHNFYGPGYSIAHPGTFPFHLKADRWTMPEWLAFDWRAGWGTDDFEDAVSDGSIEVNFPPVWKEADDRYDALEIIEDNQEKLAAKREIRITVMENGSHVDGPFFDTAPQVGSDLNFNYLVTNTNEGHNLLTASLGAQPQLWANVVLIAPDGRRIWETGYTDSYGDVADIHSVDVRNKRLPYDWQLFNLQTMFLITSVKGTDREFLLPINLDIDQLPFIRPGAQPISVINHPPFIRMEGKSLAPLGSRRVPYRVPGKLLGQPGVYRLSFRMRSRMEPIYFMRFVGATNEMQRSMNEGMIDVHAYSVEFVVR